jgi:hypothetical protein
MLKTGLMTLAVRDTMFNYSEETSTNLRPYIPITTLIIEAFYILNEKELLSGNLTGKMVKMVGFRNIIAHDYEEIDYTIVVDI